MPASLLRQTQRATSTASLPTTPFTPTPTRTSPVYPTHTSTPHLHPPKPRPESLQTRRSTQATTKAATTQAASTTTTSTLAQPTILSLSTSLAQRWSKHLRTQGLSPSQARQHHHDQHVQRVRSATTQRRQAQQRPSSAPHRRAHAHAHAATTTPATTTPHSTLSNPTNKQPPQSTRDFIHNVRVLRRENIVQHTNAHAQQTLQSQHAAALTVKHQESQHRLQRSLTTLTSTNQDLKHQNHNLATRLRTANEETSSLSFNVTMLRKRLQLLTSREIENQRRLETFARFAPLFDALDTYSSPADALRRLSVLEKEQASNFAETRQAEDELKQTTKQFATQHKTANDTIEALKVKLLNVQTIADEQIATLQQDLHTTKLDVKALESFRTKYLTTQTAVRGCYERALRACALLDVDDPRMDMSSANSVADIGHPLQMLEHVGLLFE